MGKYFKVFKIGEFNIIKGAIIAPSLYDKSIYFADLLNSTQYISRAYSASPDGFYIFNYSSVDCNIFLNTWMIVLYRKLGENIREIIQDLYTELSLLEDPEEEQIGCYTFTINILNEAYSSNS